ncbi:MAG: 16S rRNA (guanine(527)-N(7))-methyltransferase RsmG [Thalassovita sp.]
MIDLNSDVSRETMDRLEIYAALLEKWNPRINLVSKSTISDMWQRHFVDSAQIFDLGPQDARSWVDLGSGGGFPGLVIAIIAAELRPDQKVTLVESDARKSTFLRTVVRETGIKADVLTDRVEKIASLGADVVSARALADLSTLLGFAKHHLKPEGTCLFPKGVSWEKEIKDAGESWRFEHESLKSGTETGAVILRIGDIVHV